MFTGNILNGKSIKIRNYANRLLTNLVSTQHPSNLGIDQQELEKAQSMFAALDSKMIDTEQTQILAKQKALELETLTTAMDTTLAPMIRRIKLHPDYTPAVAVALGLDIPSVTPKTLDLPNTSPSITAIDQGEGKVEIRFSRYNSDGIATYSKRADDADWVLVGRATVSPFLDIRPMLEPSKPELRRYCAVYVKKDKEIGHFSDEVEIACAP